mmetsp:Transcript_71714/g.190283  ORF Transcript_71714/g.190283 Transcript_71714/m.190283 type:complete len:118 (+) Transcript_71714:407-760(+)
MVILEIAKAFCARTPDLNANMTISQAPWREAWNYIVCLDNSDCAFHVRGQLANIFGYKRVCGQYGRFGVRFVSMKLTVMLCPILKSCLEIGIPHAGGTVKIRRRHKDLKVAKLLAGT